VGVGFAADTEGRLQAQRILADAFGGPVDADQDVLVVEAQSAGVGAPGSQRPRRR
jgi:hypothetical protein